ncbi:zf-HC2 domain-containing protein [Caryophanon tenue]|uniref:Anti-sigma-W factor RsiW n=1 Tax=Caryophanon tenue TaxID=33978 RepID=A0A1C0YDC0_9BACL|nr:zf-HC2 domain-containing protein [Caryophanon tenue]OCS85187.1 anti-sigma factor [Caryophanon tenue]
MNKCPQYIVDYMHEYLDGDIQREQELELKNHLQSCTDCQQHMHELSDSIAFIKSATHISAPPNLEIGVMARLPKPKQHVGIQKWLRRHPFIVAAATFIILMSGSLLTGYNDDQQFSVTKQPNLVVDGQTVIVPEGETVTGDIVVRNGDIRVEGEVDGNITVINGEYMASTSVVTGQVEEIDKAFEWLWYEIKSAFKDLEKMFESDETK